MKTYLLPSLKLTLVLILICSLWYPLLVAGIAKFSPGEGNGVAVTNEGRVVGYENIGQKFTDAKYFWGRPSAVDYNSSGSGGSNKGASNSDYLGIVQARIDTFLVYHPGVSKSQIPAEMVTASGSGLDPNISVNAAKIQVKRIATNRNISETILNELITECTETAFLGLFGPEKINVLKLNIKLDQLK